MVAIGYFFTSEDSALSEVIHKTELDQKVDTCIVPQMAAAAAAAAASDNGRLTCCPTPKVSRRKIDSSYLSLSVRLSVLPLPPPIDSTQSDLQIV